MAGSIVSEERALSAMRAWRRGVGALEPWFRATPFASAHHYRGRIPNASRRKKEHARLERLLRELPFPVRDTLSYQVLRSEADPRGWLSVEAWPSGFVDVSVGRFWPVDRFVSRKADAP